MEFLFSAFALVSSSFADVKGKQHFSIKRICDNRTVVLQYKCIVVALPVCCTCTVWYEGLTATHNHKQELDISVITLISLMYPSCKMVQPVETVQPFATIGPKI